MNRQYRLGILIVLGTVAVSSVLATLVPAPRATRAVHDLEGTYPPLGSFAFTERSGRRVTDADLADRVWVASFVFTRCTFSCPRISTAMKVLQDDKLADSGIQLVSISVDPGRDTPAVLKEYAEGFQADPDRWWFLTAPETETYRLIREGFKLGAVPRDPTDPEYELMEIAHSEKLALVDRGNRVVGFFSAEDPVEITLLVEKARRLDLGWVAKLPVVNASLNALATVLLLTGLILIRSGRRRAHGACMAATVLVSAIFLACYLVYHARIGGGVPFRGVGPVRWAYFTILISHVVLAAAALPLILLTISRAARQRFDRHAVIASLTFPVWLYVSVTGVVVYLMLYQMTAPVAVSPG